MPSAERLEAAGLGEHTEAVLVEAGMTAAELRELRRQNVIG